jgi:hypothetical protein
MSIDAQSPASATSAASSSTPPIALTPEMRRRRQLVAEYLSQRATDAGQIAAGLQRSGVSASREIVEEDIKAVRGEWRRGRRAKLEEVGDITLHSLDTDELSLRQMLGEAQKQKNLSICLKLLDMIRDTQKMRLQIAGLLTVEGQGAFRAGVGEGLDGEMGTETVYRFYSEEEEGPGVVGGSGEEVSKSG